MDTRPATMIDVAFPVFNDEMVSVFWNSPTGFHADHRSDARLVIPAFFNATRSAASTVTGHGWGSTPITELRVGWQLRKRRERGARRRHTQPPCERLVPDRLGPQAILRLQIEQVPVRVAKREQLRAFSEHFDFAARAEHDAHMAPRAGRRRVRRIRAERPRRPPRPGLPVLAGAVRPRAG